MPVHLPPAVYTYMIAKMRADLPALAEPDTHTREVTGTLVASAIRVLTERTSASSGGTMSVRESRTVAEAYRETYRTLLRFGSVAQVEQLAPLWQRLANSTKGEQHTIMVQEFQRVCMARGLSTELYVPIVTATLKQMVVRFQFVGNGVDNLNSGSQPFLVSYARGGRHMQALAAANIGNQLAQGEQNASLADCRSIREKEKIKFPRNVTEVCIMVGRYAVLFQALFQGTEGAHPLVATMWNLYSALNNAAPFITKRSSHIVFAPQVTRHYYACVLRAIQVNVHEYMQEVSVNVAESHEGVGPIKLRTMIQELKRGTFQYLANWVLLPEEYLEPMRGAAGAGGASGSTGDTPSAPSVIPVSGNSSVASGRTGVSLLTTDTTRQSLTRIENSAPDAEFSNITVRPGGTRPILRDRRQDMSSASHGDCEARSTQTAEGAQLTSRSRPQLSAADFWRFTGSIWQLPQAPPPDGEARARTQHRIRMLKPPPGFSLPRPGRTGRRAQRRRPSIWWRKRRQSSRHLVSWRRGTESYITIKDGTHW